MTKFYLDTHTGKAGERAIRVSVTMDGNRLLTSIGYGVNPQYWLESSGRVDEGSKSKPTPPNRKGVTPAGINARIAQIAAAFALIDAQPGEKSISDYKAALEQIKGQPGRDKPAFVARSFQSPAPEAASTSSEVMAALIKFVRNESVLQNWTEGTLQTWHSFKWHLQAFNPDLRFSDFNEAGLEQFVVYLRTRAAGESKRARAKNRLAQAKKELADAAGSPSLLRDAEKKQAQAQAALDAIGAQGLEEKTAQKYFKHLRWFLHWAIRKHLCEERAIESFQPSFTVIRKPVIYLTWEELMKLYAFEIPENGAQVTLTDAATGKQYVKRVGDAGALAKTRDLFCFCAFTSLRYSDMAALKRSNIFEDRLRVTTKKTNDSLIIELNDYSREILEKYKGLHDPAGRALPVISNAKMNSYLKDLCELCGFNEPIQLTFHRAGKRVEDVAPKWALITTHAARRTFICNALRLGITPNTIMQWTGHSDYNAMKPYIAVSSEDTARAMALMNKPKTK